MADITLRTILPIFLLIGTGFLARKGGILRAGDERVLSAYLYFFALPALFLVNMAETEFTSRTLRFILAGLIPGFLSVGLYLGLFFLLRLRIDTLYLLILSTVFGSHAFFGIPFVIFAFPTPEGERLAILAASFISMGSVFVSLTVLELYGLGRASLWEGSRRVAGRLVRNPLILSISVGAFLSLSGLRIPGVLSTFLHMLGRTTATVALFMLGVFLYGRRYKSLLKALKLSILRMVLLPLLGVLSTRLLGLEGMERAVIMLMLSMPLAISMIVLSQRYGFQEETVASLILVSSVGAALYLNLWLAVLI